MLFCQPTVTSFIPPLIDRKFLLGIMSYPSLRIYRFQCNFVQSSLQNLRLNSRLRKLAEDLENRKSTRHKCILVVYSKYLTRWCLHKSDESHQSIYHHIYLASSRRIQNQVLRRKNTRTAIRDLHKDTIFRHSHLDRMRDTFQ